MKNLQLVLVAIAIASLMIACGRGPQGNTGANGANGAKGDVGATGPQGPAGADGQIATVVQLCPGVTVYPSVFTEVALCINDRLYAVYSANGGFMTLLTPGNYSSNGIGSACNLTVQEHCIVISL